MWESLVAKCGIFSCSMWTLSWGKWDLVPWWRIKPRSPEMGVWRLSHWATREVPTHGLLNIRNSLLKLRCSVQQMLAFSSFSITLNISMIHQLPHHQFPYMQPKQLLCMYLKYISNNYKILTILFPDPHIVKIVAINSVLHAVTHCISSLLALLSF